MRTLPLIFALFAGLAAAAVPARAVSHEVPANVTVLAFIRPEGARLQVLVRVPLEAMRDVEFPLRGPGQLRLDSIAPYLRQAAILWVANSIRLYEDGRRLDAAEVTAVRASLPSDRSFTHWASAMAHVQGEPLPAHTELLWQQALLDVLLEVPITSAASNFAIEPALAHLGVRTTTVLRFVMPDGGERSFRYDGDPGLVQLDPRWHQAVLRFVQLGFLHILEGLDHLLFVLCLVIPFRRIGSLIAIVTAFTLAHSITLIAAALGYAPGALWFPPLVELLIALSIVTMAFENIVGAKLERRWPMAFGFGLVHGFGFSFLLSDSLQFAGSHLVTSLLAFNLGVELGQLAVVLVAVPLLGWLFRSVVSERMGVILLSALIAHTAWHWTTERASTLREYRWQWPSLDAAFALGLVRAAMLLIVIALVAWLLRATLQRFRPAIETPGS